MQKNVVSLYIVYYEIHYGKFSLLRRKIAKNLDEKCYNYTYDRL